MKQSFDTQHSEAEPGDEVKDMQLVHIESAGKFVKRSFETVRSQAELGNEEWNG
jgi:hypothetical protein